MQTGHDERNPCLLKMRAVQIIVNDEKLLEKTPYSHLPLLLIDLPFLGVRLPRDQYLIGKMSFLGVVVDSLSTQILEKIENSRKRSSFYLSRSFDPGDL